MRRESHVRICERLGVKFPRSTRQLHLVFNDLHEIVACKLTPGQVHDTQPVPQLTKNLLGKLFGDKGYIGKRLTQELLRRGLTLFTRTRKNMKALPLTMPTSFYSTLITWMRLLSVAPKNFLCSICLGTACRLMLSFILLGVITAYQTTPLTQV